VWSLSVVVINVGIEYRPQVSFVEDEESVETFCPDSSNESLGVSIRSWRPPRSTEDPDPLRLEHLVECGTEALVTVVDQELDRSVSGFPCLGKIPGDLSAPREVGGSVRYTSDQDFSGMEIDEEEHMELAGLASRNSHGLMGLLIAKCLHNRSSR
jgi:hypothetical protein